MRPIARGPRSDYPGGTVSQGKHDEFVDLTSMGLRHLRDNGLIARAPSVSPNSKR